MKLHYRAEIQDLENILQGPSKNIRTIVRKTTNAPTKPTNNFATMTLTLTICGS